MSHKPEDGTPSEGVAQRPMSRLGFLRAGAAVGVTGVAGSLVASEGAEAKEAAAPPALRFLTQWEFDYLDGNGRDDLADRQRGAGRESRRASATTSTASSPAAGGRATAST